MKEKENFQRIINFPRNTKAIYAECVSRYLAKKRKEKNALFFITLSKTYKNKL